LLGAAGAADVADVAAADAASALADAVLEVVVVVVVVVAVVAVVAAAAAGDVAAGSSPLNRAGRATKLAFHPLVAKETASVSVGAVDHLFERDIFLALGAAD